MNLIIGSRSRRRVVVCVQVFEFWVRTLCRVRISGRFGRVGPDFGHTKQRSRLQPRVITRDCGELARFEFRFGICAKSVDYRVFRGPLGLPRAGLRFEFGLFGVNLGSNPSDFAPFQAKSPTPSRSWTHGSPKSPSKPSRPQMLCIFRICT